VKNKVCFRQRQRIDLHETQGIKKRRHAGGRMHPKLEDKTHPFCYLPSYYPTTTENSNETNDDGNKGNTNMEFITKYGIIHTVKDERYGPDLNQTALDLSIAKPDYQRRQLWRT